MEARLKYKAYKFFLGHLQQQPTKILPHPSTDRGGPVHGHGCGRPLSNRSRMHFKLFFNKLDEIRANKDRFHINMTDFIQTRQIFITFRTSRTKKGPDPKPILRQRWPTSKPVSSSISRLHEHRR